MDEKTGEVVYTDLVLFDTLTPDTAFLQMLNYVRSDSIRNKNIQANSDRSLITFTTVSSAYSEFPDRFGEILCDVVIKYFPNKFAYRITNFRHVPLDDFPPCTNNLNVVRPKCFEGKPYEKYWGNVKECAISSMNDFIIKLLYVSLENQPTTKTLKMDDYFLWRNRG
ncbi:MAG: hypothetical protein AAF990_24130 [Bacteroidota bacterium]